MSAKKTFVVSLLMLFAALCVDYYQRPLRVKPNKPFSSFPTQVGQWIGRQEYFSEKILRVLGVDDYFLGVYRSGNGQEIELYIGFYEKQTFGDQIHSPKNCMLGAGWNIISSSIENIALQGRNAASMEVATVVLEKDGKRQLMIYWFDSGGRTTSSEYLQRVYIVLEAITKRRTDGTFVRLIAPLPDHRDGCARTAEYVKNFARLIIPILQGYVPP